MQCESARCRSLFLSVSPPRTLLLPPPFSWQLPLPPPPSFCPSFSSTHITSAPPFAPPFASHFVPLCALPPPLFRELTRVPLKTNVLYFIYFLDRFLKCYSLQKLVSLIAVRPLSVVVSNKPSQFVAEVYLSLPPHSAILLAITFASSSLLPLLPQFTSPFHLLSTPPLAPPSALPPPLLRELTRAPKKKNL